MSGRFDDRGRYSIRTEREQNGVAGALATVMDDSRCKGAVSFSEMSADALYLVSHILVDALACTTLMVLVV